MKNYKLNENEARTVIAVFSELGRMPYDELNTFLGSITIEEMNMLYWKLKKQVMPESIDFYEG